MVAVAPATRAMAMAMAMVTAMVTAMAMETAMETAMARSSSSVRRASGVASLAAPASTVRYR
jgi:hypothetical protein